VLIADDEPSVRLLLRVNLPLSGFEVVEAANGEEALAQAREARFDLFVLDVMMPGLSGLEVAARLRAEAETSAVPFVFISARADEADVREGYALGAADYITKPFDPLRLGERLRAVLDAADPGPEGGAG
jgi:DNA-binding response OmpR family regulator